MNLVKVIKQIESDINQLTAKKDEKIKKIEDEYNEAKYKLETALKVNKEMNTVCLECEGKGRVGADESFYGERREMVTCSRCNGTGKEPEQVERWVYY